DPPANLPDDVWGAWGGLVSSFDNRATRRLLPLSECGSLLPQRPTEEPSPDARFYREAKAPGRAPSASGSKLPHSDKGPCSKTPHRLNTRLAPPKHLLETSERQLRDRD